VADHGVNVVGFLRSDIGIGEAARRIVGALDRAAIPFATVPYRGPTLSRTGYPPLGSRSEPVYDTNLICVNADTLPFFAADVGEDFFARRYSIGLWFWEVSRFPEAMRASFDYIDEVWVTSEYARSAISSATTKPVVKIPVPVEIPTDVGSDRARFGLPEAFTFLFAFNFHSVFERKNPLATIDAFSRAFAPGEGPVMVVKSANGDTRPERLQDMREAAADRPDIRVVDGYFSPDEQRTLMATCDCFVSLHRSEGWGLGLAEAMALGKPVIATAYSGNLEFMDEANSYLIPYRPSFVPEGVDPYPPGAEWAEPDVAAAAAAMRAVVEDRSEAAARAERGRRDVRERLSADRAGALMARRLGEVWAERDARGADPLATGPSVERRASAIERILRELSRAPEEPLAAGRAGGPSTRLRRALARALWPYLKSQRQLDTAIVDALRDLEYELHELQARVDELSRADGS
jgi:glycosyltransferase involved in cell wall biosynthesis